MADCTPTALAQEARCFLCAPSNVLEAIKTLLLCRLLQHYEPTMNCDVQALASSSTCFQCADQRTIAAIQTQLLCSILTAVEGGTGTGVVCGPLNPPVANPGVSCQIYYNPTVGGLWSWDDNLTLWVQLIGG